MEPHIDVHESPQTEVNLSQDFPDIEDVEGYVEQIDYFNPTKLTRAYFYRVGNGLSTSYVRCGYVDCAGFYNVRDIISAAYKDRSTHLEGDLPCPVCAGIERHDHWCKAKFSIDIKYVSRE